jgi:hypothetical protein
LGKKIIKKISIKKYQMHQDEIMKGNPISNSKRCANCLFNIEYHQEEIRKMKLNIKNYFKKNTNYQDCAIALPRKN